MLKSTILMGLLSLFIINVSYVPQVEAGWFKDAVKDKLRKDARKKIREEERKSRRKERDKKEVRRSEEDRKDRKARRKREARREDRRSRRHYSPVRKIIVAMKKEHNRCVEVFFAYKEISLCFRNKSHLIKRDIIRMQNTYLTEKQYNILEFMHRKLSRTVRKCEGTRTWVNEANCFRKQFKKIIKRARERKSRL